MQVAKMTGNCKEFPDGDAAIGDSDAIISHRILRNTA
jgi:hypothetical protein